MITYFKVVVPLCGTNRFNNSSQNYLASRKDEKQSNGTEERMLSLKFSIFPPEADPPLADKTQFSKNKNPPLGGFLLYLSHAVVACLDLARRCRVKAGGTGPPS